jgi:hypothetical protein
VRTAHQLLGAPAAVQLRHEQRRDEEDTEHRDHDSRDLAQYRPVLLEELTQAGGGHAERHEHRGEGQAEEERGSEHLRAPAALLDVGERDARDRRQVAGHERQDAGGHERDEADREGGEDGSVDRVLSDHSS